MDKKGIQPWILLSICLIAALYSCALDSEADRGPENVIATSTDAGNGNGSATNEQITAKATSALTVEQESHPTEYNATKTPLPVTDFNANQTSTPSIAPTSIQTNHQAFVSGDTGESYWLVIIENAKANNLLSLEDGTFLLHGAIQVAPYQEIPLLVRLSKDGEILWQRTITGFDPRLVNNLANGGILLVDENRYMVMDISGKLLRLVEISPGSGRTEPSGFSDIQSSSRYGIDEVVVLDRSGVVSFFNADGDLLRQEYSDASSGMKDWMRWVEPQSIFFLQPDSQDYYGFRYRLYNYQQGDEHDPFRSMLGTVKLGEGVLPSDAVYFLSKLRNGYYILAAAVEGNVSGAYDIWIVYPTLTPAKHIIIPGIATQTDFKMVELEQTGLIIGNTTRLYEPVQGTYLRLIHLTKQLEMKWDVFFGTGDYRIRLAAGEDHPDGGFLLVGNLETDDHTGSDLFILKSNPVGLIPGCPWLQPSVFGSPRSGNTRESMSVGEAVEYKLLSFERTEVESLDIRVEESNLQVTRVCEYSDKKFAAPSPTP